MKKILLIGLLLLGSLVLACERSSNAKARSVWMQHQKVVEAAANGDSVDLNAFSEAARFFETFGVIIPGDHSPVIDWYPTDETAKALPSLRQWYRANGSRLYWDEKSSKVLLRPRSDDRP